MDEKLAELSGPEAEIEDLLSEVKSPEGIKPRVKREEARDIGGGVEVRIDVWHDPNKPVHRDLHVYSPDPDGADLGRTIDEHYDLTERRYSKHRIPARNDWIAIQPLDSHDMGPDDDAQVQEWLEKFKAASSEGEVVDEDKKEEK